MKRLIFFSTAFVALVFSFCFWMLAPSKSGPPHPSTAENEANANIPRIPSTATLPVRYTGANVASSQAITNDRKRIFDSLDIMKTIEGIQKSGTQDEKNWANILLVSCNQLLKHNSANDASNAASSSADEALAAKKKIAANELSERCKGVGKLTSPERRVIQDELNKSRSANHSLLGQLEAAGSDYNDRWNSEQIQLISNSLYSGDPIIAKTAFLDLMAGFDRNAPGAEERLSAFQSALAPIYLNFPLSDFERLDGCRSMGWCDGYPQASETPTNPENARLMRAYKSAADSHLDVRSILAIR